MRSHPALYQVDARIWAPARIESHDLDQLADLGIDCLWLMGVWQTGDAGRQISRTNPQLLRGYSDDLPGFAIDDVCGSPFAVADYRVAAELGGNDALARLRSRLAKRGMRLILDFIPNHTARDHWWVREHPDFYIHGSEDDLAREPQNYCRIDTAGGPQVFALGRDPSFAGWPDTLQLNYGNPAARDAVARELIDVSELCDGVRCDMAMLLLPEVFQRTWGVSIPEFWPDAIARVRGVRPDFVFLAEVYWDLEWEMQRRGFDYTYDKRLYDRIRNGDASGVRDHLAADPRYQSKLVRFLENHDEQRAAAVFPFEQHRAAAVATFLTPGMRLFHDGQWEGRKRHASVHLCRRAQEGVDESVWSFYSALLGCLERPEFHEGAWRRLDPCPASDGNESWRDYIAFSWTGPHGEIALVVVNYAPHQAQCRLPLPFALPGRGVLRLRDMLSPNVYDRDRAELNAPGLYLDMPAWGCHVFEVIEYPPV